VIFSSDLSLDKHVPAFVQYVSTVFTNFDEFDGHWTTSPPRYLSTLLSQPGWTCNMVLAGALRSVTDRLQRVLNAAARVISGMCSMTVDCRSCYIPTCTGLMWQIESGTSSPSQYWCLHNKAPKYLTDCCIAVSDVAGRQRLHSAHHRQLDVPHYQRTTLGRRAFSVAVPTIWNLLPDELRDETENTFLQSLKMLLYRQY